MGFAMLNPSYRLQRQTSGAVAAQPARLSRDSELEGSTGSRGFPSLMQMEGGDVVTVAAELVAALDFPALVFPANGRDPFPLWAPAFAGVTGF